MPTNDPTNTTTTPVSPTPDPSTSTPDPDTPTPDPAPVPEPVTHIETDNYTVDLSEDGKSITITPTEEIASNTLYDITVAGLTDEDGNTVPDFTVQYRTPYDPMYCTLDSLKMVVDTFGIPDENMLSYIRQASKEADFVMSGTTSTSSSSSTNNFAREQFVRTKATYDCLTRAFMDRAYSGAGATYTLDTATFEDSLNSTAFKDLLGRLEKELQKWQDAMRGYFNEGRAKPKSTRIGIKSSENSDVAYTNLDTIIQDVTRSVPQWS